MKRMALALAIVIGLSACSNSDIERQRLKFESEASYGVARTVKAYSATGEPIGEWHGRIDVEYVSEKTEGGVGDTRVDLVFFDGDTATDRIVISGNAIVVVDND